MAKNTTLTVQDIATALIEQNPDFKQELVDNDGNNYNIAAAKVRPLLRDIGKATGSYVKLNEMAWACINAACDNDTIPRLQLKL